MTLSLGTSLELIGTAAVLGSVFWRVFVADQVKAIADAEAKLQLEHKLDMVFMVVAQHFRLDFPDKNTLASSTDVDAISKAWTLAGSPSSAARQSGWMLRVAEWSFLLGSLAALVGKYFQGIGQ